MAQMYSFLKNTKAPQRIELYLDANIPNPELVSSVFAFVFDKSGNLLMVQEHRGTWDIPGGGREEGESLEETAMREVREEAFVKIKDVQVVAYEKLIVSGYKPEKYKWNYPINYMAYVVARVENLEPFIQNDETKGRKLFTLDDAIHQDGIVFQNHHSIFDYVISLKVT